MYSINIVLIMLILGIIVGLLIAYLIGYFLIRTLADFIMCVICTEADRHEDMNIVDFIDWFLDNRPYRSYSISETLTQYYKNKHNIK